MTQKEPYTLRKFFRQLSVLGGVCVGTAAAVITAKASHDVAVATHFTTNSHLAWFIPLGVEGGSITFAALAWDASSQGEGATKYRAGLLFFMAMSVAMNLYHVKGKGDFALVEAFFFPIALVLVVEALLGTQRTRERKRRQVANASQRKSAAPTPPVKTQKPANVAPVLTAATSDVASTPTSTSATSSRPEKVNPHADTVDKLLAENPSITGRLVGEELGVSDAHGRKLLAAARKRADDARQVA